MTRTWKRKEQVENSRKDMNKDKDTTHQGQRQIWRQR